jgi:hypothetical protein
MTARNPSIPARPSEQRRPSFPLEKQPGGLFLGWGPRI